MRESVYQHLLGLSHRDYFIVCLGLSHRDSLTVCLGLSHRDSLSVILESISWNSLTVCSNLSQSIQVFRYKSYTLICKNIQI